MMVRIYSAVRLFALAEDGASLFEYAVLVAFLAMACFAAMSALGISMSDMFTRVNNKMSSMVT